MQDTLTQLSFLAELASSSYTRAGFTLFTVKYFSNKFHLQSNTVKNSMIIKDDGIKSYFLTYKDAL